MTAWIRPIVPNGETVTFYDGGSQIGTGTTIAGGLATLTTSVLTVGAHSITAGYIGDATYAASTSTAMTQYVHMCHPTTTLATSLTPAAFGAPVTFTATISPVVPDGETVTFYDGATSKAAIGTGTTSGGVATLTTSALAGGSHTIWANYAGDANFAYSWSNSVAQSINQVPTSTGIKSSPNPSACRSSVTFTAWIRPVPADGETVTFYDGGSQIGTGTTSGGLATCATSTLAVGSHSITASYPGDALRAGSTSAAMTQSVLCARPSTLVSSISPAAFGTSVTFTATISPSVPDGETVNFYDGAVSKALIGTGTTSSNVATFTTSTLAAGNHTIWANYTGDPSAAYSWSSPLTQSINQAPTTIGVKSAPNPSCYGASVTFTAWIRPIPADGETVTFSDSGSQIGTGTTAGGLATFATTSLGMGGHSVTASYPGDATYAGSTSSAITQTVLICRPTTTLTSSLNPSPGGTSVTFTATIRPSVPDGETVTFYDGATSKKCIGTGTTLTGVATFKTSSLSLGVHTIWANYAGDANDVCNWSNGLTQTVNYVASVTTTLTSSLNPAAAGAYVTFTATIAPGVPDGETVTFRDGGASMGTSATAGSAAIFTTSLLAIGSHSITASYPGDAGHSASTSSVLTQVIITSTATTTTLASFVNPSWAGASVPLAATISPSVPDGETVTFYDGGASVGTATTAGSAATLVISTLSQGSHYITATYSGDSNYAGSSSNAVTETVNGAGGNAPTITLASSLNPSVSGESVTFIATITSGGNLGNGVSFYDNGVELGGVSVTHGSPFNATWTTSSLTVGIHNIVAVFSGYGDTMGGSSNVLTQTVNAAGPGTATSITLASLVNPSWAGASVPLIATISPSVPDGETVTYLDNGTSIGTAKTVGSTATLSLSTLVQGTHYITATYAGDSTYAGSASTAVAQTVNAASGYAPTVSLVSTLNPSFAGSSVTFTATITSGGDLGNGLSFYDNGVAIGGVAVTNGSPFVGTVTTSTLTAGLHNIVAVFSGYGNTMGGSSNVLTQTVNAAGPETTTTTTLTSLLNPSNAGIAVPLVATISPSVPDGETVTFYDGGATIGTATTASSVATLMPSTLGQGTHNVTATYVGDSNYAGSASAAVTQTVNGAGTAPTIILTSSLNPSSSGESVTFSATVTSPDDMGNSVSFYDNGNLLGAGGLTPMWHGPDVATLTTSALAVGVHNIVAVFSGYDYTEPGSSNLLTQTVN